MSGTGMGARAPQPEREPTPAELHLGDRLAALIDGELGHDARERVLSHLATCGGCKAEADAQRRVKNVFADTAPPPPSDGLLARLQGLPACGSGDGPFDGVAPGSGGLGGGKSVGGLSGTAAQMAAADSDPLWPFDQLRGGRGGSALSPSRGFRIHDLERLSSRGRRFAFAAAGAVSLAALALAGGMGAGSTAGSGSPIAKGDGGAASASSIRTASSSGSSDRERRRRDASTSHSAVSGTALSSVATAGDSSGAALKGGRGTGFQQGAPWAAPTAPPAEGEPGAAAPAPLLREAFLSAGPMWSARASAALGSYGYGAEAYAGLPADTFPGGAIRKGNEGAAPPVTTAAPPQR